MHVIFINLGNFGSTGNIILDLANALEKEGNIGTICCPSSRTNRKKNIKNQIFIGSRLGRNIHLLLGKLTGLHGLFSIMDTYIFLKKIDRINPDVIHLHNLHDCYINLPILFHYLKKSKANIIWTLHDCWSITGSCTHFSMIGCEKWKYGCVDCPQINVYPSSLIDQSKVMWRLKKKLFTGIEHMTLVAPSNWLQSVIQQSFMSHYNTKTIFNGVNLVVFKKTKSNFRAQYSLENKNIVLGVAFSWSSKKGLDIFIRLAKDLPESYQIILVGVTPQIKVNLPNNIISIAQTSNQLELAQIYSASDVFVNPTREEVLGLTNIEALACGTPVVTFNAGGSPECLDDKSGYIIEIDDYISLKEKIMDVCLYHPFSEQNCRKRAELFNYNSMINQYLKLYHLGS